VWDTLWFPLRRRHYINWICSKMKPRLVEYEMNFRVEEPLFPWWANSALRPSSAVGGLYNHEAQQSAKCFPFPCREIEFGELTGSSRDPSTVHSLEFPTPPPHPPSHLWLSDGLNVCCNTDGVRNANFRVNTQNRNSRFVYCSLIVCRLTWISAGRWSDVGRGTDRVRSCELHISHMQVPVPK
jgi:hypothetical protein